MFDMKKIGMKIQSLRKNNNMTQMELADKMGVSFQAVSNWERGNSMPDVAKLPELSNTLNCTIDDLLGNSHDTELTKAVISGMDEQYIKENNVSMKHINNILPIMKPEQAEETLRIVIQNSGDDMGIDEIAGAAPFLEMSFLEKLADKVAEVNGLSELSKIAPFLSSEAMDTLIEKYIAKASQTNERTYISEISSIAPFLSNDTLNKLAEFIVDIYDINELTVIAPFLSEETLSNLFRRCSDDDKINKCSGLYPFLSSDVLKEVASELVQTKGMSSIKSMMPFL